ncbi:MAG TPA: DHH family phosphoesterase [Planctomycetota bacterium]|nr:DHH family phosphoesterase [Planctomycetota bacterium]
MSVESLTSVAGYRDAHTGRDPRELLENMADAIRTASSVVIASHVQPDGDALGSAVGLGLGLRKLGKSVRVALSDEPPEKFRPFLLAGAVEVVPSAGAALAWRPVDLCCLLDTSEPQRAGLLHDLFFAEGQARLCLDHHPGGPPGRFDVQLVLPEAPATGSLVLLLLDVLGVRIDADIAQALWIALATDTGWFRFQNTTPWALRDAARLREAGIDTSRLYRAIYEDIPLGRARLQGHVLANLRAELDGAFVWGETSKAQVEAEGLQVSDLDGVIDSVKAVRGVIIAALVVRLADDQFKVSLRAPGDGAVDGVARRFGGGGHVKAAGFRFSGTREALLEALRSSVAEALRT